MGIEPARRVFSVQGGKGDRRCGQMRFDARLATLGAGTALTDAEFALIESYLPAAKPGGRPRTTDVRQVFNAMLYIDRTGCQWRHLPLPPHFRPAGTV